MREVLRQEIVYSPDRRRGDGVSGAGAGARLDEKSRGTPTYAGQATTGAITVFAGPKKRNQPDRREEARAAAVSEERLPCVAHAGPAGDGDLRPSGGEARQYTKSGVTDRTALLAKHHATAAANMV